MAVGLGLTICVQSSSITTSALTPLVGIGVITIERMYPIVLGANIGTCITGVLAALAASADKLSLTLQVAYSHLFFNLTGIFIWYVIWPMRQFPIRAAKFLGNTTAEYRWFALAYLFFCFLIIPAIFMGIAFGGPGAVIPVVVLCVLVALFVAIVNTMQFRCPERLPATLAAAIRHVHLRAVGRAARQVLQVLRQGRRRAAQGPQGPGQGASGQHGRARQGR